MATTVSGIGSNEITSSDVAFAHKWLSRVQHDFPQASEVLLTVYFESEADPSADAIAEALNCSLDAAEAWRRYLQASLISPGHYLPLFESEDVLVAARMQHRSYSDEVHQVATRIADLSTQIHRDLSYKHSLTDEHELQTWEDKITALDTERLTSQRRQQDLDAARPMVEQAQRDAQAQVEAAQEGLQQARIESLQQVEAEWLRETVEALAPALEVLRYGAYLDQSWKRLGIEPSRDTGAGRIKAAVIEAIRSIP